MNVDAPAVAEKSLHRGGAKDQQRIPEQRTVRCPVVESGIDAALDQPGQGDAREIGADQREDAEDKETTMTVDKKLNAVVITKNLCVPFLCGFYGSIRFNHEAREVKQLE